MSRSPNKLQIALLVIGMTLCPAVARGQSPTREYKVKLAFLFKFCQYIETKETVVPGQVRIGVLGANPFHDALNRLEGRVVAGRKCHTVVFADADSYQPTDILFIPRGVSQAEMTKILNKTTGRSMLIVGESLSVLEDGGVMSFEISDKGQVDIYLNATEKQNRDLTIDARLQKICKIWPG